MVFIMVQINDNIIILMNDIYLRSNEQYHHCSKEPFTVFVSQILTIDNNLTQYRLTDLQAKAEF